jgi:ABC-type dipeptide/oligopeptide/nickel transport system permease subunit
MAILAPLAPLAAAARSSVRSGRDRGLVDTVLMRLTDLLLSLPTPVLAIAGHRVAGAEPDEHAARVAAIAVFRARREAAFAAECGAWAAAA